MSEYVNDFQVEFALGFPDKSQEKSLTLTEDRKETVIYPDPDFSGMSKVTVKTEIIPENARMSIENYNASGLPTKFVFRGGGRLPLGLFSQNFIFNEVSEIEFAGTELYQIGTNFITRSTKITEITLPYFQCTGGTLFLEPPLLKTVYMPIKPVNLVANAFDGCKATVTDIYVSWKAGEVAGAPWGAVNARMHYEWSPEEK